MGGNQDEGREKKAAIKGEMYFGEKTISFPSYETITTRIHQLSNGAEGDGLGQARLNLMSSLVVRGPRVNVPEDPTPNTLTSIWWPQKMDTALSDV